jgi:hypothetical protein
MRSGARTLRVALPALAILALAALPAAAQVFGPRIYTRSASATPDTFTDTFTAAGGGRYALWVQNGDDGGGRVADGSITINGSAVAGTADFTQDFFHKRVMLTAGTNSITVTIGGDAGSFVTVGILSFRVNAEANLGRLVLPYGSDPANLVIELKNHSPRDRQVKVNFYSPAGALVASSAGLTLAPRASSTETAQSLIAGGTGTWTEGSIDVFWAGRGGGRLFGQAAVKEATTQTASVVPLQFAGWVRRPLFMNDDRP